jgi:hypothetical protein
MLPGGVDDPVWIGLIADKNFDSGVRRAESPQHMVEGTVLHHEDDDVLEIIQSG